MLVFWMRPVRVEKNEGIQNVFWGSLSKIGWGIGHFGIGGDGGSWKTAEFGP